MKKSIKKVLFVSLAIMMLALCCIMLACGDKSAKETPADYLGEKTEYTQDYTHTDWRQQLVENEYKHTGEGITVDGDLSDAKWAEVSFLEFSTWGASIKFGATFGEEGFYAMFDIDDKNVYCNPYQSDIYKNSSVEIFGAKDGEETRSKNTFNFQINTNGTILSKIGTSLSYADSGSAINWMTYYFPAFAKGKIKTDASGAVTGLAMEGFFSYECIGLTEKPEKILLWPQYNYTEPNKNERLAYFTGVGQFNSVQSFYQFDENGYINADSRLQAADIKIGASNDGIPASSGMDFSSAADGGIIKTNARAKDYQWAFFDEMAEEYMVTAKVKAVRKAYNNDFRVGLVIGAKNSSAEAGKSRIMKTFTLRGDTAEAMAYNFETTEKTPARTEIKKVTTAPIATTMQTLTAVKKGNQILCYINDTYCYSVSATDLIGQVSAGIFAMNCEAEFADYSFTSEASEINAYLKSTGVHIITVETVGGVTFSGLLNDVPFDESAVVIGNDTNLTITVKSASSDFLTYQLTSVLINGEEKLSELDANGTLNLGKVTDSVTIKVIAEIV